MSKENFSAIEKSKKLRNYIYSKAIWKTYAFVPPSIILFAGLLGLIYLYKNDLLISWYSIPFIIVFLLGTIWFKATRKYLINQKIEKSTDLIICTTIPLFTEGAKETLLFSTGSSRHNSSYLEKQKQVVLDDSIFLDYLKSEYKSESPIQYSNKDIYIIDISLKHKLNKNLGVSPFVILINNKDIRFISKKQLLKLK